jgi:phosphoglycerate dehydrogenase-like enzyme
VERAAGAPPLGRHNVVHTPHAAGRTRDANHAFADDAIARFKPREGPR